MPISFDMSFDPTTPLVSVLRRFVLSLYERILADIDASSQLALATHELLENAVKFATDTTTMLQVTMEPQGPSTPEYVVTIRTRNRATQANIQTAQTIIRRVREAADPAALYHDMILASAAHPDGSGLGLARIRAETDMSIDAVVENDMIEIVAQTRVRFGHPT